MTDAVITGNGYDTSYWERVIAERSPEELARIIVSDLKFLRAVGETAGLRNAARSIQGGSSPEDVLSWPQAQDDYADNMAAPSKPKE